VSKFYVGQRVRVLVDYCDPTLVGAAGHIACREDFVIHEAYHVEIAGQRYWYTVTGIAPLDDGYDGRELASWAACPWHPSRELAKDAP
jgi:hypothetical protein